MRATVHLYSILEAIYGNFSQNSYLIFSEEQIHMPYIRLIPPINCLYTREGFHSDVKFQKAKGNQSERVFYIKALV